MKVRPTNGSHTNLADIVQEADHPYLVKGMPVHIERILIAINILIMQKLNEYYF